MLSIVAPPYRFCPFCGRPLAVRIEEQRERQFCSACRWTHYPRVACSASGIILRDGSVLLVRRATEPYQGTWMFPSGFVEYGEHPVDTLRREIAEETGLQAQSEEFLGVYQSDDDPREPGPLAFFYKVETLAGELSTDRNENDDIGWFDYNAPPEVVWKLHRRLLRELRAGLIKAR